MAINTENRNLGEENRVAVYLRNDINNYVSDKYNYEIILSPAKKAIIIILNIFTGGIGTILVPFLNERKQRKTMIFAGILIGLLEILHFLHILSVLTGNEYIEKFYNYISDDKFLKYFFDTKDNEEDDYYPNEKINVNEMDDSDSSIFGFVFDAIRLNLSKTISKQERIKWLKIFFSIISGMSYCASIFAASVNLIEAKPQSPNYKLGLKIFSIIF